MLPGQGTSLAPCVSILNVCRVNDRFFFKDFIYLFLERGEGKEKERERNINVWLLLTEDLAHRRPGLQPRHVPRLGIKLVTLWFAGQHSIH